MEKKTLFKKNYSLEKTFDRKFYFLDKNPLFEENRTI